MQEFLQIILSFPTALYTLLLGVAVLYWIFVILGALDLDIFHMDADLDVDVDVALPGADIHVDAPTADADGDVSGGGALVRLLSALGWTGVPITITLSVFFLLNWALTYVGVWQLGHYGAPAELAVFLASMAVSAAGASLVTRPLRRMFKIQRRVGGDNLIGRSVVITSGQVSEQQGRALLDDGAVRLDLSVRSDAPNGLARGMEALIIGYDHERHVYFVEPMGVMFASPPSQADQDAAQEQRAGLRSRQ